MGEKVKAAKVDTTKPIKDMHMAICENCGMSIIEIVGVAPYSHMATGHELCDAPPLSQSARDAAQAMIAGGDVPTE